MIKTHLLIIGKSIENMNMYIDYLKQQHKLNTNNILEHDCCISSGLKFIREKIHQYVKSTSHDTKYIILKNAHYLTMDAQSSLRRTIEVSSHTTRFILTTIKTRLLIKPIVSRLSHILLDDLQLNERDFYYKDDVCYRDTKFNKVFNSLKYINSWNNDIINEIETLYKSGITITSMMEMNKDTINQTYYPEINDERIKMLLYIVDKMRKE